MEALAGVVANTVGKAADGLGSPEDKAEKKEEKENQAKVIADAAAAEVCVQLRNNIENIWMPLKDSIIKHVSQQPIMEEFSKSLSEGIVKEMSKNPEVAATMVVEILSSINEMDLNKMNELLKKAKVNMDQRYLIQKNKNVRETPKDWVPLSPVPNNVVEPTITQGNAENPGVQAPEQPPSPAPIQPPLPELEQNKPTTKSTGWPWWNGGANYSFEPELSFIHSTTRKTRTRKPKQKKQPINKKKQSMKKRKSRKSRK
uniref:Uncharacterized protein n=1 Tax=viral metagenome TaxID=1070528 RepID=A0A6C0D3I2_9ZZZZ